MDQLEFDGLHASCVNAFDDYVTSAEATAAMLARCTPDPMPLAERLGLLVQERAEEHAHFIYLNFKRILHDAARLGYHFST